MIFFSSFLKQKKTFVFILLVFFVLGLLAPNISKANVLESLKDFSSDFAARQLEAGGDIVLGLLGGIGKLAVGICMTITWLGKVLLEGALSSEALQQSVTKNETVVEGWTIVRDFANMFIVLGFVIIGIATILRLQEYAFQKLLLPLIIVAILINFSLLICGVIIDGTNITMNYFLTGNNVGAGIITRPLGDSVASAKIYQEIDAMTANTNSFNFPTFASLVTGACIFSVISGMLFVMYAALFIFRQAALMCLVILAPLAFVCRVFPATQEIWKKWWSQFTQWALVGIPATFFIFLGGKIATSAFINSTTDNVTSMWDTGAVLNYFVPVAFLYFAYTLTFQISAIGAAGAIGLATGAMGMAWGATKLGARKAGGFAANTTGATRVGRWAGDKATAIGERLGMVSRGTLAQRQEARQKESIGRVGLLPKDQRISLAKGRAFTKEQKDNKAAAIRSLINSGDSDAFKTPQEKERALAYITSAGYRSGKGRDEINDFAKQDYRWAMYDTNKVNKHLESRGLDPKKVKVTAQQLEESKRAVAIEQLEINWGSMSQGARRGIDINHLTDDFVRGKSAGDMKAFRTASKNTRDHLRAMASSGGSLNTHLNSLLFDPSGNPIPQDQQDVAAVRNTRSLINELQRLPT